MSIQSILQGIPQTDNIAQVRYLFDNKVIMRGAALKENDIPIIEVELKKMYTASQVRSWLKQIKSQKKSQANHLSHIEIAKKYLANGARDITLYGRSDFHRYDCGVWSILPELFLRNEIGTLLEKIEKKNSHQFTSGQQKSVADFVQQRIVINDSEIDKDDDLVNMTNGVFSISQQKLLPHSPDYHLTTQLPFAYDPKAKCDTWLGYLETSLVIKEIFGGWVFDQQLIDFVQEAIGYSLTSSMIHHKMFWCIGEGSNGKGVLFHILQKLAGNAATPINVDLLNQNYNTYQLAMLAGKRLAYCTEISRGFDFANDASLKAIVAGDTILVRQIRERPFVLESTCKVWISLNDFPNVRDTSYGFWRRVTVIPFNRIFDERQVDTGLKEKLEKELPGIFNWAMEGLTRLLQAGEFTQPRQVIELTAKHKLESNTVEMFIQDSCVMDSSQQVTIMPLYRAYKQWAIDNGYRAYAKKNFKKELERLGHIQEKLTIGLGYRGIGLKPPF